MLSPRYVGPFEILKRVGPVAYRLALPPALSKIHDVFHVSALRKYIPHPSHVLKQIPMLIQGNLTYEEIPVEILDQKEQVLRTKTVALVKVLWRNQTREEATWESKEEMKKKYPQLFSSSMPNFQGRKFYKEGRL